MFKQLWRSGLLLLLMIALATPARAQKGIRAILYPPNTEQFPRVVTYLDIHREEGGFVHGLRAAQIQLYENGRPLSLAEFTELRPGVQVVVAVNPGPPFAIRNSQGLSRYDLLVQALVRWAKGRSGSTLDDLNLIITAGPERTHFSNPGELALALEEYTFDGSGATTSLETLAQAVEIASDSLVREGMERAVVFITSPLGGDITFGLQNLIARAAQERIRFFIWYVASPQAFETPEARQLSELALQSGGDFLAFSGEESLPDLETYLHDLRDIYRLAYDSLIIQGGEQQLEVEIAIDGLAARADPLSFELELLPPDPAFILPSMEILREIPEELREQPWDPLDASALIPEEHVLQVLVDYPDGRIRPLERTALYVDGVLVGENTEPPFDFFTWDLRPYTSTAQHLLRVEAQDSLGIVGSSIEIPVQISVELPSSNPMAALVQRWPVVLSLAGLLLGALLLLALITGGRLRPSLARLPASLRRRVKARASAITPSAPVPDPRKSSASGHPRTNWVNRLHWPQRRMNAQAHAYLNRIYEPDDAHTPPPISISADEITFGSDPNQATLLLDDLSVQALHARLVRQADGEFYLSDEGSVAGTWVNYLLIPGTGARLEHGDLIHIGRVGFRFSLREPQRVRKLVVTIEESGA